MPYFFEILALTVLCLIAALEHSRKISAINRLLTVSWNG